MKIIARIILLTNFVLAAFFIQSLEAAAPSPRYAHTADIKRSFEKFFELNPKAISWRHNYARYAYWCEQWDVLQEQINLMGEEINYSYFGGREEFDKMVKLAAEHGAETK